MMTVSELCVAVAVYFTIVFLNYQCAMFRLYQQSHFLPSISFCNINVAKTLTFFLKASSLYACTKTAAVIWILLPQFPNIFILSSYHEFVNHYKIDIRLKILYLPFLSFKSKTSVPLLFTKAPVSSSLISFSISCVSVVSKV